MKAIAKIRTDFPDKFGIPRQSGLVEELKGTVVFEPEFRVREAVRGLEGFSHLWLIWGFSTGSGDGWSPTVRPPKLGGNTRMGVFATRSPFRPNPIGLSSVKLESIEYSDTLGALLHVSGVDMVDNTEIFDIKPYVPYSDCHTDALGGFSRDKSAPGLTVILPQELENRVPPDKLSALLKILQLDPRPAYQNDPERLYGFRFAGMEIKFSVDGDDLSVKEIVKL